MPKSRSSNGDALGGGEGSPPTVVVIGAGIVGLAAAYYLQLAGRRVTIIDRDEPGMQCSFGNAGSLSPGSVAPVGMPGIASQVPQMLFDPNGPLSIPATSWISSAPWLIRFMRASRPKRVAEIADALDSLLAASILRYREMMEDLGGSDLIRLSGQLQLYPDERSLAKDRGGWELRRRHGVRLETVGPADIRDLEPHVGPAYRTGYFLPDQGMVRNPLRLATLIAEGLTRRGVTFVRDEAIDFLREDGRVAGIVCANEEFPADDVVVCAGAWSGRLLKQLGYRVPLETQRGYHLTLPDSSIELSRPVVAADRKVFATSMEMGLRLAGTVEFGGFERPPALRRARALMSHGKRLLPALDLNAQPAEWMGHRPCLPDSLPVLGPSAQLRGLWFNFGHGHLGLTMAASSGDLLARAMEGKALNVSLSPYSIDRFGPQAVRSIRSRAAGGRVAAAQGNGASN